MEEKKILFIEDDPDQILIYQNKFKLSGFAFVAADSSKTAVAQATAEKPDIILLDLLVRGEDGLDILAELKKNKEIAQIPVIVFTNFDTQETRDKAKSLGALDYIVKAQVKPSEMVDKIKALLNS